MVVKMNPISDFLLVDAEMIANIDIPFLRVLLAYLGIVHSLVWTIVLILLPFKLLSWIVTSRKG